MYNLYYEKDKLLEEFYTTGKFTNKDTTSEVNESVHNRRQINEKERWVGHKSILMHESKG